MRGAAHVFRFDGAGWVEQAKLRALDGAAGDRVGVAVAVAVDGKTVSVGAVRRANPGNGFGAAITRIESPEPRRRARWPMPRSFAKRRRWRSISSTG